MGCAASQPSSTVARLPLVVPLHDERFPEAKAGDFSNDLPSLWQGLPEHHSPGSTALRMFPLNFEGLTVKGSKANPNIFLVTLAHTVGLYNSSRDEVSFVMLNMKGQLTVRCGIAKVDGDRTIVTVCCLPGETVVVAKGVATSAPVRLHVHSTHPAVEDSEYMELVTQSEERLSLMRKNLKQQSGGKTSKAIAYCLEKDKQFMDLSFPVKWQGVWRLSGREGEALRSSSPVLFGRSISPMQVVQGDCGDSWLVGAIAALAEYPEFVQQIFSSPNGGKEVAAQERRLGIYHVHVFLCGRCKLVVLDGFLPYSGREPTYCKNPNAPDVLWMSLLEKACAKLNGGYDTLEAGDPLSALEIFTGCPTYRYDQMFNAPLGGRQFFDRFEAFVRSGFLVLLHTPIATEEANDALEYELSGLPLGQTFLVLDTAVNPSVRVGEPVCLVRVRNYCGNALQWRGKWRYDSGNWARYPLMAEACGRPARPGKAGDEDNTSFWISWMEVRRFFMGCGVCFRLRNSYHYRVTGRFDGVVPSVCLHLSCAEEVEVGFSLELQAAAGNDGEQPRLPILLSLYQKGDQKEVFEVKLNSCDDPGAPGGDFAFVNHSRVSLFCHLFPSLGPYLLVPRVLAPADGPAPPPTPFALSLWTAAAPASLQVLFHTVPDSCPAFRNEFTIAPSTLSATTATFLVAAPNRLLGPEQTGTGLSPHGPAS